MCPYKPYMLVARAKCDLCGYYLIFQEKVVMRISGLVDMCHGVSKLESHNSGGEDVVLFQAWGVKRFGM